MVVFVMGILGGLFSIFCSVMNYNWFIESGKARFLLKLFGRTGTRIFYVLLGIIIIILLLFAYINGQI